MGKINPNACSVQNTLAVPDTAGGWVCVECGREVFAQGDLFRTVEHSTRCHPCAVAHRRLQRDRIMNPKARKRSRGRRW